MRKAGILGFISLLFSSGCGSSNPQETKDAAIPNASATSSIQSSDKQVVELTAAAIEKIEEIMKSNFSATDVVCLRVGVEQGGPTGFLYNVGFINQSEYNPKADFIDKTYQFPVVVAREDRQYLQGAAIDFITQEDGQRGFHFTNPNTETN